LINGRNFPETILVKRLVHAGISAQRLEGCQSTIGGTVLSAAASKSFGDGLS
jgi:hypothetical protein